MKKILFVTTALIATASVAAAEVRISGYGRFGIDYNDGNGRTAADRGPGGSTLSKSTTNITSRLRLQFDMSTETDSGVTFGARFRAQAESRDNAPGGAFFNGARFFASYEGFQVLVGNIIGAVENTPGLYLETRTADIGVDGAGFESVVANVNAESFNWDSYSSGGLGANGVEVIYSANGFVGHLSYSADDNPVTLQSDDRFAVMGSYNFGDWTVALSAQSSDRAWEDKVIFTVAGDLGQFGVRFAYADNDGIRKVGLYGNMDIGAAGNLVAYVTDEGAVDAADVVAGRSDNRDTTPWTGDLPGGSNNREGTGFGINYSYDLGGGATFIAGARRASNDNNTAQAGVYFSF